MKVTLEDSKTYVVKWRHEFLPPPHNTKVKAITKCYIYRDDNIISSRAISQGTAFCSVADQYNRRIGMKRSLARALDTFQNKGTRTVFWNAYFAESEKRK